MQRPVAGALLLAILLLPAVSGCRLVVPQNKAPEAVGGVLDLSGWDFAADGPVNLNGEWEFYWQRHLEPRDFTRSNPPPRSGFIRVPGYWNGYEVDGKKLSGDGFATYRLRIRLKPTHRRLALRLLEISTAYGLYLDGEKVGTAGVAGKDRQTTVPRHSPQIFDFKAEASPVEIILQVSNFHHRRGGIWEVIQMGSEQDIRSVQDRGLSLDLFLCGSILIMGLYHLALFCFRRKDRSPLYFSIFCFLILVRLLTTGERYLLEILPAVSWELMTRLEYLSFYLAVPAFALFMRSIFKDFSSRFLKVIAGVAVIFSCAVVFAPPRLFSLTLNPYEIITLVIAGYSLYVIIRALPGKRAESLVFLCGFMILSLAMINDMLHVERVIQTAFYAPFGLFIFILSQASLLSFRFSNALATVEQQGRELKQTFEAYKSEIIDRKTAEEQVKLQQQQLMQAGKMAALGTLVSGVAHEINNPNNFIMLNTPILQEAWENAIPVLEKYYAENGDFIIGGMKFTEMRENMPALFAGISDGAARIKQIIEDLKHYARNEAVDLSQEVDINAVLQSAVSLLSGMIRKFTDHFHVDFGADLPLLTGNFQRLEQVLVNLIQNACQALPDPHKGVFVSTAYDPEKSRIVIAVRDEGSGIASEHLPHIMDPLFTTRQDSGGVGLGLSISAQIVAEHGGTMFFASQVGSGTTVTVSLPAAGRDNGSKGMNP
ncbi:MAG: 7TM diverse intracellular signaling domain-containing protein [Desulfobacterales bacterium]